MEKYTEEKLSNDNSTNERKISIWTIFITVSVLHYLLGNINNYLSSDVVPEYVFYMLLGVIDTAIILYFVYYR